MILTGHEHVSTGTKKEDMRGAIPYEIRPYHNELIDIGIFEIQMDELKIFDIGAFVPEFENPGQSLKVCYIRCFLPDWL
jgi:hypothetical protein